MKTWGGTYLALMICGTAGGIGYTNLVVLGEEAYINPLMSVFLLVAACSLGVVVWVSVWKNRRGKR